MITCERFWGRRELLSGNAKRSSCGSLTEQGGAGAAGLAGAAVDVEVGVSAGAPLAEDAGAGVDDVDEVRVRLVQVAGRVGRGVEEDGRVEAGDASDLALRGRQVVGHEARDVRADAVPDEVHLVGRDAARVARDVLDHLRDAEAAEARRPVHLAQAGLAHRAAVVHDDDVVVAAPEVRLAHVGARREVAAAAEAVDHHLRRVRRVEVRVVERLRVEDVQLLAELLRAPRVQVEVYLRMRAPVRLLKA